MRLRVIFETLKNLKTSRKIIEKLYWEYEKFNVIFHICVMSFGLEL